MQPTLIEHCHFYAQILAKGLFTTFITAFSLICKANQKKIVLIKKLKYLIKTVVFVKLMLLKS